MREKERNPEHGRRDWIIILILLLLGFLCMILAGERALRFSPIWRLNANMDSFIDPDSDFLTNRPEQLIEPLDQSILTNAVWVDLYQTPGAVFLFPTSVVQSPTPLIQASPTQTTIAIASVTNTSVPITPTNTLFYYPPSPLTNTPNLPPPAPTFTNTPLTVVDLAVTKNDGNPSYVPGGTVTYTITVINNGTGGVTGAVISDNKPVQVTTWDWACTSQNGGASGCDSVTNSNTNFSDTVNLPSGASIVYTVTSTISGGASGSLVNTATVSLPAGYTDPTPGDNSATDIDTQNSVSDLSITKTNNSTDYVASATKTYVIVVSNAGPSDVSGATVADVFSTNSNIASSSWTCAGSGGGTCTASGSGDINDTVNLPDGASVTYTVTAVISATPSGNLDNTATVSVPVGVNDPATGNNSATDSDELIQAVPFPYPPTGEIGTNPDYTIYVIPAGTSITLTFGTPLVVGSHAGFDLIYYELPNGTGIAMDLVILQIGDGSNWYTIFNWGDGVADSNSNLKINVIGGAETDNRDFTTIPGSDILYPFNSGTLANPATGITIELDGFVPNGTYPYLRIISPSPDVDGGVEVDAIYIVP